MRAYPTAVPDALTSAIEHSGGPLLVLGGAGTGKTTALVERFAHLAERHPPESLLALTFGQSGADALRERIEDRLTVPYEELTVTTFQGLCARLLRDEALEAGIDPFTTPVAAADRLAMLLERIDDLPLRHHDLRGNPSATLGAIVRRIDSLKDELISAADYAAWAAGLRRGRDRRARARVRGAVHRTRRAAQGRRRARLRRPRPAVVPAAARAPARTRAGRGAVRPTCSSTSCRTRASRRACCCGCSWPSTAGSPRSPTTTRRSTASAARRPRTCATSAPSGRRRRWSGSNGRIAARGACWPPRGRWWSRSRSGSRRT